MEELDDKITYYGVLVFLWFVVLLFPVLYTLSLFY
ncbi:gp255.1 [Bacillus phage W.Ph.]|uniref:Gp255.1 n=1 Tax=Bacillus phage W.Ph. TaxID=764595 RepID=L7UUH1_9CAUD|nr:gp255.1 [Bacillus phage W.Ph.]AGC55717.1 gp255.1 [Bacillus phage W.Ph.]